ncbi:MAG: esterase family protein [bacterium]|nr:esterase family protein [bacterium]
MSAWLDPDDSEPQGTKYCTFFSEAAGQKVSYQLYLPPDYEADTDKRYPVVYWLHGRGGNQRALTTMVAGLEPAIRAGKAPPMIVVGVNGRRISTYVDAADGSSPVQTMIVKDLIAHVDATCRTIAGREGRAIEGFSMGGAGAARVAFNHPEVFGVVSVLGGAVHDLESMKGRRGEGFNAFYGGSDEYFLRHSPWTVVKRNADAIRGRTTVRVCVGEQDRWLERNRKYHELLKTLKIEHEFHVAPEAGHSARRVYAGLGDKTWKFYSRAFASPAGTE